MDWASINDDTAGIGYGRNWTYLVTADLTADGREMTGIRLTRYNPRPNPSAREIATEAAANVIIFPLGRAGGRPAMVPELAALMEAAKTYAERFESGHDLPGYAAWRHPLVTRSGRVLSEADIDALVAEAEAGYGITGGESDGCASC